MKNKSRVITLSIVFVLVILIAVLSYNYMQDKFGDENNNSSPQESNTSTGPVKAPDFTVFNSGEKGDENKVNLSDFIGKPVVINFWASWCGPCKSEMPVFDMIYKELDGEVVFLMVNLTDNSRETVSSADNYIEKNGYSFPILYDLDFNAASVYGVSSIPATLFIDDKGYIKDSYLGALNESKFRAMLAKIYNK